MPFPATSGEMTEERRFGSEALSSRPGPAPLRGIVMNACPMMKMLGLIALSALAAAPASADHRGDRYDRGRGAREDRREYRRERIESRADVDEVIKRAENAGDELRKDMNEALDKGRLNGTRREDLINDQVNQLEDALDRLRKEFDDDADNRAEEWRETRPQVRTVLAEAADVEWELRNWSWPREVRDDWRTLDTELNRLERIYGIRRPTR